MPGRSPLESDILTERHPLTMQELIDRLLSPERERELDPFMVITFMPMDPYERVADIGCGPGFFSVPLAKYLVYGKLYCLDVMDEMLEVVGKRVAQANLGNVEIMKCGPTDFPVPEGSLDGVFLAFVVHQAEDRVSLLKAAGELLKLGGWCTVLEWFRKGTECGPPLEHRIEPREIEALAGEAGFQFRSWRSLNGRHYMAVLRKGS